MTKAVELHPKTTPLSGLPANIYYHIRIHSDLLIAGIFAMEQMGKTKTKYKYFSINKYTLPIAYKKAIAYIYGKDKLEEILKKYPVPYIHPTDLYQKNTKNYVYGIMAIYPGKGEYRNHYLSGFVVSKPKNTRKYFSIRKLGLEEAWKRAVEYRYSIYEPMPTDKPELPAEYWDLINPKYKTKTI